MKILSHEITCTWAPAQIEGVLTNGLFFYARSRHSHITISIADTFDQAVMPETGALYTLSADQSIFSHGCCEAEQLLALTSAWIEAIQEPGTASDDVEIPR